MKTTLFALIFSAALCCLALPLQAAENKPAAQEKKDAQYQSVEERRLMESINETTATGAASERENLENRKKELKRLEEEVDKKLDQLNQLRLNIEKLLAAKDAEEQKRISELAKMYEKMSAEKAAAVFTTLDKDLAIAILGQMKTKSAARILNNMERDKAAKLTTAFSAVENQ